jgi:origin recognition complex subunit 4
MPPRKARSTKRKCTKAVSYTTKKRRGAQSASPESESEPESEEEDYLEEDDEDSGDDYDYDQEMEREFHVTYDSLCIICSGGISEEGNQILLCDGILADGKTCDLPVHQECYEVPEVPEGDW